LTCGGKYLTKPVPKSRSRVVATTALNKPFKNKPRGFGFQENSPHRIFSHGSSIVKAKVHSNHIRYLHISAPNADAGGRVGNDRDVRMEMVDGAAQDCPSLEEPEVRSLELPI
jgi:hypothetical protein